MEEFYIIKVVKAEIFDEFISDLERGSAEYRSARKDKAFYDAMPVESDAMIVVFESIGFKAISVYACKATKLAKYTLKCEVIASTNHALNVKNLCENLFLNLQNDFPKDSYLTKECAVELYVDFLNEQLCSGSRMLHMATELDSTKKDFNIYKHEDCESIKMMHVLPHVMSNRKTYARDRDRVLHSKAFRRLVDKAQIFTSQKGDHYRTRMTHTLEVNQIARGIACSLQVNEDLVEAIALCHDIGHTPFGHVGERTLDDILSGKHNIIRNIDDVQLQQGFKHNYQALRVLSSLELKYPSFQGINLSYQVMEGAWKHTDIYNKEGRLRYDLKDFFLYPNEEYLYPEYADATTLEGQIVAIADEIAQRSHDIDDAFKSHKLNIRELQKNIHISKSLSFMKIIAKVSDDISKAEESNIIFVDKEDMFRARLCSEIITYFVENVVSNSTNNIEAFYEGGRSSFYDETHRFDKKLIDFNNDAHNISKSLEQLVSKKVIISTEVTQFDTSSREVILKLFDYYYKNPLALPGNTLQRLYLDYIDLNEGFIDFRNGNVDLVRDELKKITLEDIPSSEMISASKKIEYFEKRRIMARCIADHIGGMTDSFAIQEYHKLYNL